MIKAHELRIGNHVYLTNDNGETYIDKIDAIDIYDCWVSPEKFNQSRKFIPITEELLIKAGARKMGKNAYNLHGMLIHFTNDKWIEYVHRIELEGIHHLQNVFYFTRGEELIFEGLNQ
jgi:hypothetical protein